MIERDALKYAWGWICVSMNSISGLAEAPSGVETKNWPLEWSHAEVNRQS